MTDTANGDDLTLDQAWVMGVYEKLGKLEIDLDPDPLIYGPKRLNGKVALARNMLRDCEKIFLQVSHDMHRFSRALRVSQTKLKLSKDYLFANDPETRAGRNVSDRESIATMKLRDQVKEAHRLELAVEDLKSVMDVVKAKRSDLRDVQSRIRDQIRLCQEELGLGGRWGSRRPNAPDIDANTAPSADVDEITALLDTVDGEIHLEEAGDGDEEEPEDLALEPNGLLCSVCGSPQFVSDSGDVCEEGHGGALGLTPDEWEASQEEPEPEAAPEEPESESLDSVLGATATVDEVDSFLDGFDGLEGDEAKPKAESKAPADDFDFLLDAFGN